MGDDERDRRANIAVFFAWHRMGLLGGFWSQWLLTRAQAIELARTAAGFALTNENWETPKPPRPAKEE